MEFPGTAASKRLAKSDQAMPQRSRRQASCCRRHRASSFSNATAASSKHWQATDIVGHAGADCACRDRSWAPPLGAALTAPHLKARIADFGGSPVTQSPAVFGKFIAEETEKWSKGIGAPTSSSRGKPNCI